MKVHFILIQLCLYTALGYTSTIAQQVPVSLIQVVRPQFMNPGHFPGGDLHELKIGYQQRSVQTEGWRSASQFLHYQSRPMGQTKRFSWGLLASNDHQHTENRMGISGNVSVQLVKDRHTSISLGGAAGLINWNSNYSQTSIYDRLEPILYQGNNFFELNASVGAEFSYQSHNLRAEGAFSGKQLSGSLLTNQLDGINLLPHLNAGGGILFAPGYNLYVGPQLFYQNTLNQRDTTLGAGTLDLGFRAEFDRQHIWFSGMYRIDNSALSTGFGVRLASSDTLRNPRQYGRFIDLYAQASQPLRAGDAFGPTFELGLSMSLGKRVNNDIDTLRWARTFWKTEAWMTEHKERFLNPISPLGLEGEALTSGKYVFLDYSFPDVNLRYAGNRCLLEGDFIPRIGGEWEGVDGLLSGLVEFTTQTALHPDSSLLRDPENLEPLKRLLWVELGCEMRDDAISAKFGSNVIYGGELGTNNPKKDTLFIDVVFDDRDTTIGVPVNKYINNLELACLKLYAMRGKLQYELERWYGEEYNIERGQRPEDWDEFEIEDWKPPIRIKKPRILSDRPNLQVFAENYVLMKFVRHPEFVDDQDDGWIQRPKDEEDVPR